MRYLILVLMLTSSFSQELEVEGNLKVQGNIDASNQRVTNVGNPTDLSDAVNTEFLQNALRDDDNYEYKIIFLSMAISAGETHNTAGWFRMEEMDYEVPLNSISGFTTEFTTLLNNGWILDSINGEGFSWWIFKRPLSE